MCDGPIDHRVTHIHNVDCKWRLLCSSLFMLTYAHVNNGNVL